jgi:hypothetical protein
MYNNDNRRVPSGSVRVVVRKEQRRTDGGK